MANVLFKRGNQSQLPASPNGQSDSVVDGALYFTVDTKRLFLGNGTTLLPIAEGITSVGSATSLPTASEHNGEFYYIAPSAATGDAAGNILAYSDGTKWLQVNMSNYITSMSEVVTVSSGNATVTLTATDNQSGSKTASFKIYNGGNVTLTTSGNDLVISVPDDMDTLYTVTTVAGAASTNHSGSLSTVGINLVPTASTGNGTATSTVTFKESDSVAIKRDSSTGEISFEVIASGVSGISSFTASTLSAGGFQHDIGLSSGSTKSATIDPTIAYGSDGSGTTSQVHFLNGEATLDVYTVSEVDSAINSLKRTMDAMKYRGTVATFNTLSGLSDIENGNAWKASDEFTIPAANSATGAAVSVEPGYLIIAQPASGTSEDANGYLTSPVFDVVAGDSTDTEYKFATTTHGVLLQTKDGTATTGTFKLATNSGNLTLTDSASGGSQEITIDLATISVATTTGTAVTQNSGSTTSIDVITGVTVDGVGRVTGVETTTLTMVDSIVSSVALADTVSTSSNKSTVSQVVTINGSVPSAAEAFSIESSGSLTLTSSGKAITVDLVWGDFS